MIRTYRARDTVQAVQWDGSEASERAIRQLAGPDAWFAYGRPVVNGWPLEMGDHVIKEADGVRALADCQFAEFYEPEAGPVSCETTATVDDLPHDATEPGL